MTPTGDEEYESDTTVRQLTPESSVASSAASSVIFTPEPSEVGSTRAPKKIRPKAVLHQTTRDTRSGASANAAETSEPTTRPTRPARSGAEDDLARARSMLASNVEVTSGDGQETVIATKSTVDYQEDFYRQKFLEEEKKADAKAARRGY